jgi:uncharacterized protein YqgC (DUF456 family)
MEASVWVPALLIAVGLVGVVVPVLPGLLLVLAAILLWAWDASTPLGWGVFVLAALLWLGGMGLKYLVPGRRMRRSGVRTSTLVLGVALGIVGFVVIPVVGGPLGFVLGIYAVEHSRWRDRGVAWASTTSAVQAVALSVGIELVTGLAMATAWVAGVLLSR